MENDILSYDKSIVSRSDFADKDVLQAYEESKINKNNSNFSNLLLFNDELYLFKDFPSGKGLSIMCISINKDSLFNLVSHKMLKPGGAIGNVNYLGEGDYIKIPRVDWGVGMGHKSINAGLTPGGR